jgi:GT2 family glycosyltransferase
LGEHSFVAAVGPRLINADGSFQISASRAPTLGREIWRLLQLDRFIPISQYPASLFLTDQPVSVEVLLGASILLRSQLIQQIGLFDEDYFVYSEEVDLCERIRNNGWELHWLPSATVTHFGGMSTRQVSKKMFIELYRNKIKFFRKNRGIFQARIYKVILFFASIIRIILSWPLKLSSLRNRNQLITISENYKTLIRELPNL